MRLDPTVGHEQAGTRPALVVSVNRFNQGPAELAIVLPVTSSDRRIPTHIRVEPREGGLKRRCFVMCEAVRCVSTRRFIEKWGRISHPTQEAVEDVLRILLDL